MRTTHAPTLRSLIERLRVDALRVAAEKKSWQRRPSAGGCGRRMQRRIYLAEQQNTVDARVRSRERWGWMRN